MRTLTTLWVAGLGVLGFNVQVTIAAAAIIVYLVRIYPRKAARR
jgi:hypothetical protein